MVHNTIIFFFFFHQFMFDSALMCWNVMIKNRRGTEIMLCLLFCPEACTIDQVIFQPYVLVMHFLSFSLSLCVCVCVLCYSTLLTVFVYMFLFFQRTHNPVLIIVFVSWLYYVSWINIVYINLIQIIIYFTIVIPFQFNLIRVSLIYFSYSRVCYSLPASSAPCWFLSSLLPPRRLSASSLLSDLIPWLDSPSSHSPGCFVVFLTLSVLYPPYLPHVFFLYSSVGWVGWEDPERQGRGKWW